MNITARNVEKSLKSGCLLPNQMRSLSVLSVKAKRPVRNSHCSVRQVFLAAAAVAVPVVLAVPAAPAAADELP
jgi:hypothetical protein